MGIWTKFMITTVGFVALYWLNQQVHFVTYNPVSKILCLAANSWCGVFP